MNFIPNNISITKEDLLEALYKNPAISIIKLDIIGYGKDTVLLEHKDTISVTILNKEERNLSNLMNNSYIFKITANIPSNHSIFSKDMQRDIYISKDIREYIHFSYLYTSLLPYTMTSPILSV